jgi:hypothetical protein
MDGRATAMAGTNSCNRDSTVNSRSANANSKKSERDPLDRGVEFGLRRGGAAGRDVRPAALPYQAAFSSTVGTIGIGENHSTAD